MGVKHCSLSASLQRIFAGQASATKTWRVGMVRIPLPNITCALIRCLIRCVTTFACFVRYDVLLRI